MIVYLYGSQRLDLRIEQAAVQFKVAPATSAIITNGMCH